MFLIGSFIMPKILVVSAVNVLDDPRIFYKLVLSLKKEYDDVTYMVKSEKKSPFIHHSVQIDPLPIFKSIILRFLILHWIILWKTIKGKYEIVQFNSPELIFVAYILKKLFNKKIVFDVHENFRDSFIDKRWLPLYVRKIIRTIFPKLEDKIVKNFDVIIIAETSYRKIYGQRAFEILNFPISPQKEITTKKFDDVKNFVYAGVIMLDRCIFELLETFQLILKQKKDSKLHIAGDFVSDKLEDDVWNYIKKNHMMDSVIIYGHVSLLKVYEILEEADFGFSLLQPIGNYIESLSTKIFDYMTFGIPFAVSNFPIYEEFVVKAKTGIVVDQNNPKQIAEEVLNLISDREKIIELSKNGQEMVLKKWNWQSQEKKLIEIYKEIL
jgi:glycosyltransferase involved in cell wall biosynthesis